MHINSKAVKNFAKISFEILTTFIFRILVVLIFVFVGCSIFVMILFKDACINDISQEVYSPDNKYKVVVFQRDCGITTGFSTQIAILRASANLRNIPGNIFVMDGHPDWRDVKINWETNNLVSVSYLDRGEIYKKKDKIRIVFTTINIKYDPITE